MSDEAPPGPEAMPDDEQAKLWDPPAGFSTTTALEGVVELVRGPWGLDVVVRDKNGAAWHAGSLVPSNHEGRTVRIAVQLKKV